MQKTYLSWLIAAMLLTSIASITTSTKAFAQGSIALNGAGATFPFPLIDTWRVEYQKVNPNVSINYQSIGSGGGISQFTQKTVDFGASDAPLSATQEGALPGSAVHIPETIGSVVAAYNVIGIPSKGLKLTGPVLGDIFLGKITRWDDQAIKDLNPGVPLPSKDIVVVHRSDGSGTTFVWTDYLSKVSTEWNDKVGKGTAVPWPTGIGAPGNEGVANAIRGTAYTIGYVELSYALNTNMQYAYLQNQAGNFIEPTLDSTKAAVVASTSTLPAGDGHWTSVSMTNAAGADSYPIASFSYLLVYKEMSTNSQTTSMEKARALVDFIKWAITDGQGFSDDLSYVPLPEDVVKLDMETLGSLTFNGEKVLTTEEPPKECDPGFHLDASGNCVPDTAPPQGQSPFSASAMLDGKTYTISGTSNTTKATEVSIQSGQSVMVKFDHVGDVQLTLPKTMIDSITTVNGEKATIVSQNSTSTTVAVTVPAEKSVEIMGSFVVPEFPVIAALLVASIGGFVAYTRFARGFGH